MSVMPESNRNRHSIKGNEQENRTGNNNPQKTGYRKLPDNPRNRPDESISTADNTANGKYSRTKVRDEDIDNDNTRGGR
jgi:hypothetical protein